MYLRRDKTNSKSEIKSTVLEIVCTLQFNTRYLVKLVNFASFSSFPLYYATVLVVNKAYHYR